jgi:hypothetical protein
MTFPTHCKQCNNDLPAIELLDGLCLHCWKERAEANSIKPMTRIEALNAHTAGQISTGRLAELLVVHPAVMSDIVGHFGQQIDEARARAEAAEAIARADATSTSPCGHLALYAVTDDGGKHITCLQCRANNAEKEAEQAKTERNRVGMEIRALYLPKLQAEQAARERAEKTVAEMRVFIGRLIRRHETTCQEAREIGYSEGFWFTSVDAADAYRLQECLDAGQSYLSPVEVREQVKPLVEAAFRLQGAFELAVALDNASQAARERLAMLNTALAHARKEGWL